MSARSVRVSVPCSTSNLGPAFDCLGLALSLRNELTMEIDEGKPEELIIEVEGEGAATLAKDKTNLAARAVSALMAGRAGARVVLRAKNRIPLARGLGSSAAAIVAGLYAANELIGRPLDQRQLFEYALAMEGHPDNVAPALLGGLIATAKEGKQSKVFALRPHEDLRAVVCIPDFELATSQSRAVLPPTVLRDQAVANIGRSLLLSSALEGGRWDWLPIAMEDQLHQPYRAPLIKGFAQVLRAARAAGPCGAALSGAGPSILALASKDAPLDAIGRAMSEAFAEQGIKSRHAVLSVEKTGAEVLR